MRDSRTPPRPPPPPSGQVELGVGHGLGVYPKWVGFISNCLKPVSFRKEHSRDAQSSAPSILIPVTLTALPWLGWGSADLGRPVRAVLRRACAQLARPSTLCQSQHHTQMHLALCPLHSQNWQHPSDATRWRHARVSSGCGADTMHSRKNLVEHDWLRAALSCLLCCLSGAASVWTAGT